MNYAIEIFSKNNIIKKFAFGNQTLLNPVVSFSFSNKINKGSDDAEILINKRFGRKKQPELGDVVKIFIGNPLTQLYTGIITERTHRISNSDSTKIKINGLSSAI